MQSFSIALIIFFLPWLLAGEKNCVACTMMSGAIGEPEEQNSVDALEMARFAISEQNAKEGDSLVFENLLSARQQVVAGTLHHLKIQASGRVFEAKVWEKPWENFKELSGFMEVGSGQPTLTSADLGTVMGGGISNGGVVNVDPSDPSVQEAVDFALTRMQQSSNSLFPYRLLEVISAQAEIGDGTTFTLVLNLGVGERKETVNTVVHRTKDGKFSQRSMRF